MSNKKNTYSEVEIKNFELRFDGMFHITWRDNNEEYKWYVYLSIAELLTMLKQEGIPFKDVDNGKYNNEPMVFNKVTLITKKVNDVFEAYGYHDLWEGHTLPKDGYTVELFQGDTIKNHKGETLMGMVELKNLE